MREAAAVARPAPWVAPLVPPLAAPPVAAPPVAAPPLAAPWVAAPWVAAQHGNSRLPSGETGVSSPAMSATPLSELKALGWTGAELAKRLGVRQATVSAWRTGKRDVPPYVPEYLRLAVWIHEQGWRVP